ncbi:MAG: hypothetical protein HYW89_02750 [Candidatus Sungiibacteriota bacterium]|uniref:Uncharacterized protein n=1 Tax=Candidatus Sungiibacteriota bacterium TaxID=2750080 RepID=A0A7T5RIV7_9BACT|nr:MAG: hypothetical protein HYW89_02750 [Candidatus Sungbacteria bacterium]
MKLNKKIKRAFCRGILEKTNDPAIFNDEECEALLRREVVDWIFVFLGAFTYMYLALLAVVFFGKLTDDLPQLRSLLDSLQNPYFGALAVYVILKEIRKRKRSYPSRYLGELFVVLWTIFGAAATLLAFVSPRYDFDSFLLTILSNTLVVILIYIGGVLNRP